MQLHQRGVRSHTWGGTSLYLNGSTVGGSKPDGGDKFVSLLKDDKTGREAQPASWSMETGVVSRRVKAVGSSSRWITSTYHQGHERVVLYMYFLVCVYGVESDLTYYPVLYLRICWRGFMIFFSYSRPIRAEKLEVYFRVEPRQLVSPSIPVHYPLITFKFSAVRFEWPTMYWDRQYQLIY